MHVAATLAADVWLLIGNKGKDGVSLTINLVKVKQHVIEKLTVDLLEKCK